MAECDVDDLICQMTALAHLKGLKSVLGNERYLEEFPELSSLDEKIAARDASFKETMARCVEQPPAVETETIFPVKINAVIEQEEEK